MNKLSRNWSHSAFTLIELLIVVAIIAILAAIAVPNFLEAQVRAKVSRTMTDMRTEALALEAYTVDYNVAPVDSEVPITNVNIFADFPYGTGKTSYWPGTRSGTFTGTAPAAGTPPKTTFLNPGEATTVNAGNLTMKVLNWWEKALTTPVSYLSSQMKDAFQGRWIRETGAADGYWDTGYSVSGSSSDVFNMGSNFLYRNYEHTAKAYCKANGTPDGVSANQTPFDVPWSNYSCFWIYSMGGYRWALASAGPSLRGRRLQIGGFNSLNMPHVGNPGLPTYDPTNGSKSLGYIIRTNKGVYTIDTHTDYSTNSSKNSSYQFGVR